MRTRPTSVEELQQIFVETLINKTNKVTKVSPNSVLSGVSFGVAKIAQKALKDIALIESKLFPDYASGAGLDDIGEKFGIGPRLGASESSTFVLIFADEGTIYQAGVHTFSGNDGIIFDLESDLTISSLGYTYAKVRSTDIGEKTNVDALTINKVNPVPVGHKYIVNEIQASGGRDEEDDKAYRKRIKETPNIFAQKTLSFLDQAFNKINPKVLRTFFEGYNNSGQVVISIATENGIDLIQSELDSLLDGVGENLSLVDLKDLGNSFYGIKLKNISYQPIDISFRVLIDASYNLDEVRKTIQSKMQRLIDFRFWNEGDKVEWDDLLRVVKNTRGVLYVPDTKFTPNSDILTLNNQLPRIRGFRMMDLEGNILTDLQGVLNPVFYPSDPNFKFQSVIINNIQ